MGLSDIPHACIIVGVNSIQVDTTLHDGFMPSLRLRMRARYSALIKLFMSAQQVEGRHSSTMCMQIERWTPFQGLSKAQACDHSVLTLLLHKCRCYCINYLQVLSPHAFVEGQRLVKLFHQGISLAGEAPSPQFLLPRCTGCLSLASSNLSNWAVSAWSAWAVLLNDAGSTRWVCMFHVYVCIA